MEEKQQWLSMAAVVLVIVGLGVFLYRQSRNTPDEQPQANAEEQIAEQKAQEVLDNMRVTLPDNAERATLRDVSEEIEGAGLATRVEEGDQLMLSTLVSLPEPEAGVFYEAYLTKSEATEQDEPMYLGKLIQAKGGWRVEQEATKEALVGYDRVMVTREKVDDKQPEETILEGNFN